MYACRCQGESSRLKTIALENECLEYEIYGHFKFPHEADSVYAIGRQWVSVAHAAGQCTNWEQKKDEFDGRTDALSAPFE